MVTISLKTSDLKEYWLPYDGRDGVEVIEDIIKSASRWSIHHEIIFKWIDGKFYRAYYSEGATEMQDERPWEYEDMVECIRVHKVPKVVEVWEAIE